MAPVLASSGPPPGETFLAVLLTLAGLAAFGVALRRRSGLTRGEGGPRGAARGGGLQPFQILRSPGGEWTAVVSAGPPFEDRLESVLEAGLWAFLWLFPAPLCRIEITLHRSSSGAGPPSSAPAEALTELVPSHALARRVVWRGAGSPAKARQVRLSWTGPRILAASLEGTTCTLEVPPGS